MIIKIFEEYKRPTHDDPHHLSMPSLITEQEWNQQLRRAISFTPREIRQINKSGKILNRIVPQNTYINQGGGYGYSTQIVRGKILLYKDEYSYDQKITAVLEINSLPDEYYLILKRDNIVSNNRWSPHKNTYYKADQIDELLRFIKKTLREK
jgi:hypothetical protein